VRDDLKLAPRVKSGGVGMMKVYVFGLGQGGLPTTKYILKKDLEVGGYDINPIAIEKERTHHITIICVLHHNMNG